MNITIMVILTEHQKRTALINKYTAKLKEYQHIKIKNTSHKIKMIFFCSKMQEILQ